MSSFSRGSTSGQEDKLVSEDSGYLLARGRVGGGGAQKIDRDKEEEVVEDK